MENKKSKALREEATWAGVKSFSFAECGESDDAKACGELKGLKVSLVVGEVLEFDDLAHVKLYLRSFKSGSKALYISCLRNGERVDHLPVALFRRKPASKCPTYDDEVAKLAPGVNPLGAKLLDNAVCFNDLDRVKELCKAGKVTVTSKLKIHLQSFDDSGKPKDGEFYEQDCWTFDVQ